MTGADDFTRGPEPMERLTALCARMTEVLNEPDNRDVRAIVFLDTDDRGGIQLHGWDDDIEAMAALFAHMQYVFRAAGKDIQFVAIPESPEGL